MDKLDGIVQKFNDVERRMSDPEVIADQPLFQELVRTYGDL